MFQFKVSITHHDENKNTLVNRQEYIVSVEGDPNTENDIPCYIDKRNREAVKAAIIQYIDETGVYEGDSLYVENVQRIK